MKYPTIYHRHGLTIRVAIIIIRVVRIEVGLEWMDRSFIVWGDWGDWGDWGGGARVIRFLIFRGLV